MKKSISAIATMLLSMVLVAVSAVPTGVQAQTGTSAATSDSCFTFTRNLGIGLPSNDREEVALNTVLNNSGISGDSFSSYDEDVAARVVQLQQKYGIRATGYFGPITRAKINSLFGCNAGTSGNDCPVFSGNLNIGSSGSEVERLQTWLIANGYDIPAITEDHAPKGYFGPSTAKAFKKYQNSSFAERCGYKNDKKNDNDNDHNDNDKTSSAAVSAYVADANTDKVGSGFGQSVGIGNNNPADWHFRASIKSEKRRSIKEIYIKTSGGEGWSTTNNSSILGTGPYPIQVYYKDSALNNAYDQVISVDVNGTLNLDLYAQPESVPFRGGDIVVTFTDGTVVRGSVPSSSIVPSQIACATSDSRCSTNPVINSVVTSVSSYLADASSDRIGSGFGQSVGISNRNPADWHFVTTVTTDKARTIREIYIKSNRYGEAWSTTNNSSLIGTGPYPLLVSEKAYENTAFDQTIPLYDALVARLDLYAQPESTPFAGGSIVVNFTDGTSVQSSIPASSIMQSSGVVCSTNDSRCSNVPKPVSLVSCSLASNKSSYKLGETITYSWSSQNATYAGWQQDTSDRDHLSLPGDKLPAVGTQNVTASVVGNPSVTLQVAGYGGSSTCSTSVLILPSAPLGTVSASLVDASSDKVGSSFGAGAGMRNTNPNDWHWIATINNPGGQVSIQSISIVSNSYGEGWSTSDDTSLLGKGPYPLAMYLNGQSINSHYNMFLASGGESQTLDLYGQPETVPFNGGTIIVKLSDGTKIQSQIAASSIVQTAPAANTFTATDANSDRTYSAP
ncbi:MAG: peptidoglycan-binding domain-containing protein [Patescibacteria group bacterium]